MTPRPAASVIIAAYNAEETLGAQLEALAREEFQHPFEVLVCDNGSTDGTAQLVRKMPARTFRLVDASARRGPAAARNIGADAARADLLMFCDADDVIAPGWLAAHYAALHSADLVAGTLEGRLLNTHNVASVSWEVSSAITLPYWPRFGAGASSNLAVRADVLHSVDGFDEALRTGEDIDFCWRVQLAGHSFARCPDAVVHSRQRDGRRAVFRQAYSYGAGHRALRLKYAQHIAADGMATTLEPSSTSLPTPKRSRTARMRSLLTPEGQANLAWRLGEALGTRFGGVDRAVRTLDIA